MIPIGSAAPNESLFLARKNAPSVRLFTPALLTLSIAMLCAACGASKKLVTVVTETSEGNSEHTYQGTADARNLVSEVRLSVTGDTLSITHVLKGVLHGELVTFHPNGQRRESVTYDKGVQDGPYRAFDTEGTIVFEGLLRGGKKEGVWSTWYDATQMRQQCHYENDILSGKCTYWYIDGNLQREETYSAGRLVASQDH